MEKPCFFPSLLTLSCLQHLSAYAVSLYAVFVISSSDSDAVPQFQGALQAWRVAAAAISSENNCVLKVDVTTSTCEALTARVISAVEMNQINRLWLINQFSWIREGKASSFLTLSLSRESLQRMKAAAITTGGALMSIDPCHFLLAHHHSPPIPSHLLSCRSSILIPTPPYPFPDWSSYQSSSIIPYMNLPSNSPLLPSAVHFSRCRGAHIPISSQASFFLFPSCSISSSLLISPPCLSAPLHHSGERNSEDKPSETIGSRPLSPPPPPRPSLLQSFSAGFSEGQWLQPSDCCLCHAN